MLEVSGDGYLFVLRRDFQYSIGDAHEGQLKLLRLLLQRFQYSVGDADLSVGTKVVRAYVAFQYSVGDAVSY